jgi:predicted PurR-regulated permease PerM
VSDSSNDLRPENERASDDRERPPGERFSTMRIARAGFVIALIALCGWVLWGFLPALTWAAVIAIATWPLRQRLIAAGLRPLAAAIILTSAWFVLVMLPIIFFGTELAQAAGSIREIVEQARRGQLDAPDWLGQLPVVGRDLGDWWHAHIGAPGGSGTVDPAQQANAIGFGRDVGRFVARRVAILGFTLLTLLFLYKEGGRVVADAERLGVRIFGHAAEHYGRFTIDAVRATVNGLVFIGLIEGVLLGLGYAICGVPHPVVFAIATAVLGIIPFGAPVVLAVASLTLIAASKAFVGLALLCVGLVAIFIIDHTARPALIGGSIRLPFFWALLGVFGGLEAFGVVGLFLGPAILAVALAIWREAVAAEPVVTVGHAG